MARQRRRRYAKAVTRDYDAVEASACWRSGSFRESDGHRLCDGEISKNIDAISQNISISQNRDDSPKRLYDASPVSGIFGADYMPVIIGAGGDDFATGLRRDAVEAWEAADA